LLLLRHVLDPNFDEETTIAVWRTFIQQARDKLKKEGRENVDVDGKGIEKFARKHWKKNPRARWNGRQIRNAFLTAVAMAEFHSRDSGKGDNYESGNVRIDIGPDQFKKIAKTAKEFDDYMTETMGDTYDGKASRTNMRKAEKRVDYVSAKQGKGSKKDESTSDSSDSSEEESKAKKKLKKKKSKKEESKRKEGSSDTSDSSSDEKDKKKYKKRKGKKDTRASGKEDSRSE
jgi:hypothetical protein